MDIRNLHRADGSFLGFFFQVERLLFWLANTPSEGAVGIEVEDDIVVQLLKGESIETIYEQAKNSQLASKTSFTDKSEDLWKTLSIWVNMVQEGSADPEKCIFSAISNKSVSNAKLLMRLNAADEQDGDNLKAVCVTLKEEALKLRKTLLPFGKVIYDCDDILLAKIISSIRVLDAEYSHDNNFKKDLKNALRMSNDMPFDHIYHGLFGYVSDTIIEIWKRRGDAWITVEAFRNRYTSLIAEFKNKNFVEKASALLPVTSEEVANNKDKVYVEQLRAIGCGDEEILESIEHYFRAASEKSRYAKEGDVSEEHFVEYYRDLVENWKTVARPRFRATKGQISEHETVGYNVFYETIRYKGKLNNQVPEQSYTHQGAYHFLSNNVELGWHPDWEKKFKAEK